MKLILSSLLFVNILFANNENIVKTSELELFLFKIGFESLLKDTEISKEKISLNSENLSTLKTKIEIIMDEIYKDKRVLAVDSKQVLSSLTYKKEIQALKNELGLLKEQVNTLVKNTSKNKDSVKSIVKKQNNEIKVYKIENVNVNVNVKGNKVRLFSKPIISKEYIVEIVEFNSTLDIEYCNKYEWCKIKNEEKYIPKYYLSL